MFIKCLQGISDINLENAYTIFFNSLIILNSLIIFYIPAKSRYIT